jgi:biotin transport system substrate-specific component
MTTGSLAKIRSARDSAYRWRGETNLGLKLGLAFGMAALTGLLAQVVIPLPWTPVPITGQTFAVLLAGVLLGGRWGGMSQALYAALGAAGLPWFTGWQGGLAHLAGPTGGYLIGFVLAAASIGYLTDRFTFTRRFPALLGLMVAANFVLVYVPGMVQLGLWLGLVKGQSVSAGEVLNLGLFPFVVGDLLKVLAAATMASVILPRKTSTDNG